MKQILAIAIIGTSLCSMPFVTGCDKTVKEDTTVKKNADGTVTKDETKVTQAPNGDVVKTKTESKE